MLFVYLGFCTFTMKGCILRSSFPLTVADGFLHPHHPTSSVSLLGACQLHAATKHALLSKAKVIGHQQRWQVTPTEGSSKGSHTPCSSRKAALFYHLCVLPPEVSPCLLTPSLSSHRTAAPKKSSFPACPAAVTGQACSPLASAGSRGSQELCLGLVSTSLAPGAHLTWGLWLRK